MSDSIKPLSWFPWNGSKRWLVPHLYEIIARWEGKGKYIEPFVGGGSISNLVRTQLHPKAIQVMGDANIWLASAYQAQLENFHIPAPKEITSEWISLQRHYTDSDYFKLTVLERAVRFAVCLYTNWGNRWETKETGEFRSTIKPYWCRSDYLYDRLKHFFNIRWLTSRDEVVVGDWTTSVARAQPGDLVYLDPPYPESLGYGNNTWKFRNHLDTVDWATEQASKGVFVVVSNMWDLERLYKRAGFHTTYIRGPIQTKTRAVREELLAFNF